MTTKISTSNLDASVTTLIVVGGGPKVTAITYPGNDLAADIAGGQTVSLTGTGFVTGCSVFIGTVQVSVVTFISATSVTFTSPALAAATYTLYLVNPDGGTATIVPGISYSGTPAWTTTAGTLGSVYEYAAISNTVAATGDGSIIYSVFSGTLPTGSSLNTSTGVITGTSPASAGATTYTFVIRATDAQLQDSDRSFSITVNTDVVTWSSPAANSTVTLSQNAASTTALSATSAAGNAITYTANTLPTGLSISGATVTGTPTVIASTTSTFTATAATTGKTTTAVINWTVSVAADTYFPYTTLLLSGATATETFVADASVNNFPLTIVGDTKPNNFNPYTPGYYSNYFDGTSDYLSSSITALGTGNFTIEFWVYLLVLNNAGELGLFQISATSGGLQLSYTNGVALYNNGSGYFGINVGGTTITSTYSILVNSWMHIAITRTSGTCNLYVNGTSVVTPTSASASLSGTYLAIGGYYNTSFLSNAYISNFRIVNGIAVYTGNFAVPTAPLTAISGTSLLTCQSNRFVDNSANAFAITRAGSTKVNSFTPFVPNTAYAAYGSTYFDGTTDNLAAPSSSQFNLPGDFTIECWIHRTVNVDVIGLFGIGSTDPDSNVVRIVSGVLQFWLGGSNSGASGTGTKTGQINCSTVLLYNTWYHVALVRSGSAANNVKLYLNGVLDGQGTGTYQVPTNSFVIGKSYPGYAGEYFNGYISNVRVVKGVAVYTGTFTPPTTPLSATQSSGTNIAAITGSQTSLLTLQTNQPASNSMFLDSSTNAFAVTRAGNTSAGTFTPYGANWSNYFDGNGDYLQITNNTAHDFGTGDFSVEAWVYPTGDITYSVFVSKDTGNGAGWFIEYSATRGLFAVWASIYISSAGAYVKNSWSHLVLCRSGTTVSIYRNGARLATTTSNASIGSANDLKIGGLNVNELFPGYISNVRIVKGSSPYDATQTTISVPTTSLTAISGTTLLTCQSNSLVDNSANAFAVTRTGEVSVQRFSPFAPQTQTAITNSAYFDGTTDYLTIPPNTTIAFASTVTFTVEFWIYPTAYASGTSFNEGRTIISTCGTYPEGWRIEIDTANINWYSYVSGVTISTPISINTWTHIAVTHNGTTSNLYKNGVLAGSGATSWTAGVSSPFFIGCLNNVGSYLYPYLGYISNIRLVKGVAVYTANFTPPTTPLSATQSAGTGIVAITGTQTSLLTCQSPTFTDNSTNAFAITAFGDAKPRTLNPFGFTNASAAYSAATYGGSAYFDGTTDYLTTPTNAVFNFGTGDFTLEAWIYRTASGSDAFIMSASGSGGLFWGIPANGDLGWGRAGVAWDYQFASGMVINRWYHVALTRRGTSMKMFVDGTQLGVTQTLATSYNISTTALNIGSQGANYYFTGYISNARIVKSVAVYTSNFVPPAAPVTAITNTSLLLNMTSAGIYDSASSNNLETLADAKRVATHTPYAGSFYSNYFDGTGDWLTAPASTAWNFTGDWTWECWVYPTAITGYHTFLGHWASGNLVFIWKMNSSGRMYLENQSTAITATTTTIAANQWQHIALTRSSNTIRMFVNGVMDTTTATRSGTYYSTAAMYIGASGAGEPFTGYISNMRILNGTALYTGTFTPPTAPLTAIANTSLLTCQSNRFVDNSANAFAITKYDNTSVQSFNPFQRHSAATMYFDGTGDYLLVPYNSNISITTGNFTIEAWCYPTTTTNDVDSLWGYGVYGTMLYHAGTTWYWEVGDGGGNYFTITGTASLNVWNHIACTRSGSTFTLWINGVSAGTNTTAGALSSSRALYISNNMSGGTQLFTGYINDLRITKGIARYTGTFVPSTSAFIAK